MDIYLGRLIKGVKMQRIKRTILKMDKNEIIIFTAAVLLAAVLIYLYFFNQKAVYSVARPDGNGAKEYELQYEYKGEKDIVKFTVNAPYITEAQLEKLFLEAKDRLEGEMLSGNEAFDHIRSKIMLSEEIEGYDIKVSWYIDDLKVVNYFGEITGNEGDKVRIYATLTYTGNCDRALERSREYVYVLTLSEPYQNELEKTRYMVKEAVNSSDRDQAYEENVILPEQVAYEEIHFSEKKDTSYLFVAIIIPIIAILYFGVKKEKVKEEKEKYAKEMLREYPEVVMKLTMLLGAGLTTYNAMMQIDRDYLEYRSCGKIRPAYEEVHKVMGRISGGMSEQAAYSELGKEYGVFEFIKFGTLLSQNVVHGSVQLTNELRLEMMEAFNNRKTRAVVMGEKAGTKLLAPMMIMLIIVLVIIMTAAFMSY